MFSSNCRSYPITILNRLKMELIQKMALTFWTISKCWPCLDVLIQHGISTEAVPSVLFPFVAGFGQPWCCWLCVRHTSPLPDSRDQDEDKKWPQLDERLGGNRLDQSFPIGLDVFQQIQGQRFEIGHETSGIQVTDGNKRNTSPYYTILHCTPEVADWRSHKAPQTSFTYPALSFSSPGSHRHGIGSVWATNG